MSIATSSSDQPLIVDGTQFDVEDVNGDTITIHVFADKTSQTESQRDPAKILTPPPEAQVLLDLQICGALRERGSDETTEYRLAKSATGERYIILDLCDPYWRYYCEAKHRVSMFGNKKLSCTLLTTNGHTSDVWTSGFRICVEDKWIEEMEEDRFQQLLESVYSKICNDTNGADGMVEVMRRFTEVPADGLEKYIPDRGEREQFCYRLAQPNFTSWKPMSDIDLFDSLRRTKWEPANAFAIRKALAQLDQCDPNDIIGSALIAGEQYYIRPLLEPGELKPKRANSDAFDFPNTRILVLDRGTDKPRFILPVGRLWKNSQPIDTDAEVATGHCDSQIISARFADTAKKNADGAATRFIVVRDLTNETFLALHDTLPSHEHFKRVVDKYSSLDQKLAEHADDVHDSCRDDEDSDKSSHGEDDSRADSSSMDGGREGATANDAQSESSDGEDETGVDRLRTDSGDSGVANEARDESGDGEDETRTDHLGGDGGMANDSATDREDEDMLCDGYDNSSDRQDHTGADHLGGDGGMANDPAADREDEDMLCDGYDNSSDRQDHTGADHLGGDGSMANDSATDREDEDMLRDGYDNSGEGAECIGPDGLTSTREGKDSQGDPEDRQDEPVKEVFGMQNLMSEGEASLPLMITVEHGPFTMRYTTDKEFWAQFVLNL